MRHAGPTLSAAAQMARPCPGWRDVAGWIPGGTGGCALVNERTGCVVAAKVELAVTRRARRVGLLGRTALDEASALVLAPCRAIHTAGMRFPIDVVFVDRHGRSLRVVRELTPWRIAFAARAYAAIEFTAGVSRGRIEPDDTLSLIRSEAAC